jgi:outer membrane protein assembly factor BamB
VSVDPRDGNVYAATGNSLTPHENFGYSEAVVRLTKNLKVVSSHNPLRKVKGGDRDFGATPLLYDPPGCPPQLAAPNKNGKLYVYDRDRIRRGPTQSLTLALQTSDGAQALLGLPSYDAAARRLYITSPTDPGPKIKRVGLLAFDIGPKCRLKLAWRNPGGILGLTSTPVLAGGVVYIATGASGNLLAVDGKTGKTLRTIKLGDDQAFGAPTPVGRRVITSGWDGVVRAFSPRP